MSSLILPMMLLGSLILLFVLFFGIKAKVFPKLSARPWSASNWSSLESQAGAAMPPSLKKLYENAELINSQSQVFVDPASMPPEGLWYIEYFYMPDKDSCLAQIEPHGQVFCFADTGIGNRYFIPLRRPDGGQSAASPDASVYRHDHETGEITPVAPSLETFLSWQRNMYL